MRWRVTPRVANHRSVFAENYPCILLEFGGSENNIRPVGTSGNIMFTDNEFMEGVVLLMTYSPTMKKRIIDYVESLKHWSGRKVETLAEILL